VQSAAHRSVTVVTVMTLIFTPMLKGNHWVEILTGKTTETHTEQCEAGGPVPGSEAHHAEDRAEAVACRT
jgi:hypothetical protein